MLAVEDGDMAPPQVPICTVVQMDRVEVRVAVIETDYVRLHEGMDVTVTPPSLPDVHRTGRIASISPVIDALTRTAEVRVVLDNPDHQLRPGMVAEIAIELARRPDVLDRSRRVPSS